MSRDLAKAQLDLAAALKARDEMAAARDALRKELDAEKARHAATRARLEQADKDLARVHDTLAAAQKTTADSQQLVSKSQVELTTAQKALQEAAGAREALRKELTDDKAGRRAAEGKLDAVTHELAKALPELAAARKAADEAARGRDGAAKEVASLRERQTELTQEAEKSRRWLSNSSFPAPQGGRARFIVEVPITDAKLYIDDKPFEGGEGKVMREFVTARLTPGKHYTVDLRVVLAREGKTYSASRQVVFEPDTEQRISFPVLEQEQ